MKLVPWRGRDWAPAQQMQHEMDRLWGRFFGWPEEREGHGESWNPSADVEETDKAYLIRADLPGVDPKDVEVSLTENSLILRGERKEEHEENRGNFHRMERFTGEFYREFPLPAGVERDKIEANSSKGVLTITLPKKPEASPRRITVRPTEGAPAKTSPVAGKAAQGGEKKG